MTSCRSQSVRCDAVRKPAVFSRAADAWLRLNTSCLLLCLPSQVLPARAPLCCLRLLPEAYRPLLRCSGSSRLPLASGYSLECSAAAEALSCFSPTRSIKGARNSTHIIGDVSAASSYNLSSNAAPHGSRSAMHHCCSPCSPANHNTHSNG